MGSLDDDGASEVEVFVSSLHDLAGKAKLFFFMVEFIELLLVLLYLQLQCFRFLLPNIIIICRYFLPRSDDLGC